MKHRSIAHWLMELSKGQQRLWLGGVRQAYCDAAQSGVRLPSWRQSRPGAAEGRTAQACGTSSSAALAESCSALPTRDGWWVTCVTLLAQVARPQAFKLQSWPSGFQHSSIREPDMECTAGWLARKAPKQPCSKLVCVLLQGRGGSCSAARGCVAC